MGSSEGKNTNKDEYAIDWACFSDKRLNDKKVFNIESLLSRTQNDTELICLLVTQFLVETGKKISALNSACDTMEYGKMAFDSHAMKGAALNMGAECLGAAAASVNTAARNSDHVGISVALPDLMAVWNETHRQMTDYISTQDKM